MTETIPNHSLALVLPQFGYTLADCKVSTLGNGLINNTYLVKADDKTFVLQCLNQQVFRVPEHVTNNIDLISEHLSNKHAKHDYVLTPIWQLRSLDDKNHVEVAGQYWRSLHYIEDCFTLEAINNIDQANDVASAFAQFSLALSDFDSKKLAEIIPNFHNLSSRVDQLSLAIENSSSDLIRQAKNSIDFIQFQQDFIDDIAKITKEIPLRVTHNDTKINNLLFSKKTNKPIAVIDLDTCMAGYLMHDFGDMVRSCCASVAEDSAELNDMVINFDLVTALSRGYIAGFNGSLTKVEQKSLFLGVKLMPFMLAIRFLTDFLNGNQYFKIDYATHNLVRAENQLHLYKLFCKQDSLLAEIVLSTPE
ncbi:aminoglycoside phosphotransferase family protein [Colwellia sp. Arc7-635]|uniref:phosphotransferase enzyme family protein n=1 Tax=Colwellia sp. Arc7-635 TaxID=2497879 RepID=UPI000F851D1F|nr:aminoglycoside phosphotransferase family protein [Colwellia sp. Arc7-635]AZQ83240.1 aminoglycoside phosphotransferase family protein [Colwellia sp. Arc7-635]